MSTPMLAAAIVYSFCCGDYVWTSCPAVSDFFRRKENAGLAAEAG